MMAPSSPFTLVPLLATMRDLNAMPRDMARFKTYLQTVIGDAQRTADVAIPPLIAMNPMGKAHVLEMLEAWIALDAEAHVQATLETAARRLTVPSSNANIPTLKVGLVIVDDLKGGWSNRAFVDYGYRFGLGTMLRTGWVSLPLWTSQTPDLETLTACTLETAARVAHFYAHGAAATLEAMMRQEGFAAAFAGRRVVLDADDLEYTRAVLEPHRQSTHQPTLMAALYGDAVADSLGYPKLGLSANAGFELALAEAV